MTAPDEPTHPAEPARSPERPGGGTPAQPIVDAAARSGGFATRLLNPWRGLRGLPRAMWILAAATLVNRAGTMFMPFLVLYLTEHRGFAADRAGLVVSSYGLGALVMAPIGGALADRLGPVRVLRIALLASGVLLLCFPLIGAAPAVVGAVMAIAIASEPGRTASLVLTADLVSPAQRKPAFALSRLAANLGMTVGPALGGLLATRSYALPFLVNGIASIASAATLLLVRAQHTPGRLASGEGEDERPSVPPPPIGPLPPRRLDLPLAGALAAGLLVGLVFFQIESSMPLHFVEGLGLSKSTFGLVYTINTLLIVAIEVPLNTSMARWPHRRALALGSLLVAAGFGALALVHGPIAALATVVPWTFGEMIFFPTMTAHVADLAPPGRRGRYMGFYTMSFNTAFMLGPWLGTVVYVRLGPAILWGACFALGLVAAVVASRLPSRKAAG